MAKRLHTSARAKTFERNVAALTRSTLRAAKQAFSDGQGPDASRMVWAFAAKQFPA